MTKRIDHARVAQENLDVVGSRPMLPEVAAVTATAALVHATLALVEQQRIANLIALVALSGNESVQESSFDEGSTLASAGMHALIEYVRTPATPFSGPDDVPEIRPDIREGLGL
ncbi:hypothetical protein NS220_06070 [Microbacterium testaceum]|uniref:Uncharacterized protein n=1 Tax=Microbacterium testaceum TaxID=2033 RepID=A0A147EZ03_MICTE|nr:hypothetical protein [Microbacterium testaceum]KTR95367.1 hypothetical protein NS220_06070 [Microbacterium testaceum]